MLYNFYFITQALCLFYNLVHDENYHSAALYWASP
jgi:hypothetical protein